MRILSVESEDLSIGWEIRLKNFGDKIYFYAPSIKRYETERFSNEREPSFIPISITGNKCSLQCDHCQAKILEAMYEASTPDDLLSLAKSLLLLSP